jgi:hypothetical protein
MNTELQFNNISYFIYLISILSLILKLLTNIDCMYIAF